MKAAESRLLSDSWWLSARSLRLPRCTVKGGQMSGSGYERSGRGAEARGGGVHSGKPLSSNGFEKIKNFSRQKPRGRRVEQFPFTHTGRLLYQNQSQEGSDGGINPAQKGSQNYFLINLLCFKLGFGKKGLWNACSSSSF